MSPPILFKYLPFISKHLLAMRHLLDASEHQEVVSIHMPAQAGRLRLPFKEHSDLWRDSYAKFAAAFPSSPPADECKQSQPGRLRRAQRSNAFRLRCRPTSAPL